jgi:hypothetical protein
MHKFFGIVAAMFIAASAAMPTMAIADAGYDAFVAKCKANGANHIYQVSGGQWKCDAKGGGASDTGMPPHQGGADYDAYLAFKADCDAHHGKVYNASEWAALGKSPIAPDQLKCYRAASFTVNSGG